MKQCLFTLSFTPILLVAQTQHSSLIMGPDYPAYPLEQTIPADTVNKTGMINICFNFGLSYIFLNEWYHTMKDKKGSSKGFVTRLGLSTGLGIQFNLTPKLHLGIDNNLIVNEMGHRSTTGGWLELPTYISASTIIFTALPYVSYYPKSTDTERSPFLRAGAGLGMANFSYYLDPTTAFNFAANVEIGFDKYRNGKFFGMRFGCCYFHPEMKYDLPDYDTDWEDNDFNVSHIYIRFCFGPSIKKGQ